MTTPFNADNCRPPMLNATEAAAYLGITLDGLAELHPDLLPAYYLMDDVDALLDEVSHA